MSKKPWYLDETPLTPEELMELAERERETSRATRDLADSLNRLEEEDSKSKTGSEDEPPQAN
jgi:hypothetical protein